MKCKYHNIFSPSLCSGANIHTRIKLLFRTCIENNYFKTTGEKSEFAHACGVIGTPECRESVGTHTITNH